MAAKSNTELSVPPCGQGVPRWLMRFQFLYNTLLFFLIKNMKCFWGGGFERPNGMFIHFNGEQTKKMI